MRIKRFWHIRRRFRINKTPLKSLWSPYTLRVCWHIFRIRLNTVGVFSAYNKTLLAYSRNTHKELRIHWNKFSISTIPDDFKETVFRKNGMGDYIYRQRWASTLTSRSNARHRSNTRHSIKRSERSYFFEKLKAKILPSTTIFVDRWQSRFLGIEFFTFNEKNIAPYTSTFPKG